MNLVVEMRVGSHLHGTNSETSDTDIKGVYLPEARDIILQRVKPSIKTATNEHTVNTKDDVDTEHYSLQEYLRLVADGNSDALDMLFVNPENLRFKSHVWLDILANKEKLLSKSPERDFLRFVRSQCNKWGTAQSRTHTSAAVVYLFQELIRLGKDPLDKLETSAICFEAELCDRPHVSFPEISNGAKTLKHLCVCGKSVPYTASIKEALMIFSAVAKRYRHMDYAPRDARDWKDIAHGVRVGTQAIELLNTGNITFPRPDAKYLKRLKAGEVAFDEASFVLENLLHMLDTVSNYSSLPLEPDREWIDDFVTHQYLYEIGQ